MLVQVTILSDDEAFAQRLQGLLKSRDVAVHRIAAQRVSADVLADESIDLLIVEEALLKGSLNLHIRRLILAPLGPAVVVITSTDDPVERATLMAIGCDGVLYAPLPDHDLKRVLDTMVRKRRDQVQASAQGVGVVLQAGLSDFISNSPAMKALMEVTRRVVKSKTSLLILGETGVGKEWLARAIHAESPRSRGPFIAINCGALPENLLESELFGHERGAFTGAVKSRRGAFEMAHRGTIFLDEISEMPFHLQVKLLRVLQDHIIQRVGGEETISLDVRVMAASNRDLIEEVRTQHFRQDLYYRLGVVMLTIPPLRERKEDIPGLVESYIRYFRHRVNKAVDRISPDALSAMVAYAWPGNVREVINVVERAMLLCDGNEITMDHLPQSLSPVQDTMRAGIGHGRTGVSPEVIPLPANWVQRPLADVRETVVTALEKGYLEQVLAAKHGRVGESAAHAGLDPRSLFDKLRRYGLRKESFRPVAAPKRAP